MRKDLRFDTRFDINEQCCLGPWLQSGFSKPVHASNEPRGGCVQIGQLLG